MICALFCPASSGKCQKPMISWTSCGHDPCNSNLYWLYLALRSTYLDDSLENTQEGNIWMCHSGRTPAVQIPIRGLKQINFLSYGIHCFWVPWTKFFINVPCLSEVYMTCIATVQYSLRLDLKGYCSHLHLHSVLHSMYKKSEFYRISCK